MVACKEMRIFQEKCYILKYFQVSFTSKGAQAEVGSSALHVAGATSGRYIFSSGSGATF